MPTKRTDEILACVNNSYALRKFGAPVYVKIEDLSNDNILIRGANVNDSHLSDDEHSKIIAEMALIALQTGKQLDVEFDEFNNNEIKAIRVTIV